MSTPSKATRKLERGDKWYHHRLGNLNVVTEATIVLESNKRLGAGSRMLLMYFGLAIEACSVG